LGALIRAGLTQIPPVSLAQILEKTVSMSVIVGKIKANFEEIFRYFRMMLLGGMFLAILQ